MKRILMLISFVTAIPLGGYLAGAYVKSDFNEQWARLVAKELGDKGLEAVKSGRFSLERFCSDPQAAIESSCQTYNSVLLLQNASALALIAGLGLLLAIFLGARFASSSRLLLLHIFSPGIL